MLGGLCWFTIPFVLASTFGLAAAATEHLPSFPTYPNRMSETEITTGMAMPFAAMALMGKGGGIAVLIMVFMAVTSAVSSAMSRAPLFPLSPSLPIITPMACVYCSWSVNSNPLQAT